MHAVIFMVPSVYIVYVMECLSVSYWLADPQIWFAQLKLNFNMEIIIN